MNEATSRSYLKLAAHFYEQRLGGQQPTPKRVKAALEKCAVEYRPAYFRRLRNALAHAQECAGFKANAKLINAITNPVTSSDSKQKPKEKLVRAKKVSDADHHRLLKASSDDKNVRAAILLCKELGLRPSELKNVRVLQGGEVIIEGVKKNEKLKRGLDRRLIVDQSLVPTLSAASKQIKKSIMTGEDSIKKIQDRLFLISKKEFPRRRARPSLYSYRHQCGSNLKSDKSLSKKEIAFIMGHQATESISQYGHVKSGSGRSSVRPAVTNEVIESLVRDTQKTMNTAKMRAKTESKQSTSYSPSFKL